VTYYIVGGGDFDRDRFTPEPKDCVLAADAGYAVLEQLHIAPDAVVGDFDSLGTVPDHNNILRFPKEKDEFTDEDAIKHLLHFHGLVLTC